MSEDKDVTHSPQLHDAMHEVVENQIKNGTPKETKITLDRLKQLGYARHEAIHKIAAVLLEEIYFMEKNNRVFSETKYIKKLNKLK